MPTGSTDDDFVFVADDVYPRQRRLFDDYEAYLLRTIKDQYNRRGRFWKRDFSSPEAYAESVVPNRQHFLDYLGGWPWERQDLHLTIEPIREFERFRLERATYRVFDTIDVDALLLTPHGDGPFPAILAQVGVNGAPERICGFEEGHTDWTCIPYRAIGKRLAAHGYVVIGTRMVTGFDPTMVRDLDHRAFHLLTPTQQEIREYLLETYGKDQAKSWAPQSRARNYINRLCQTLNRHICGMEMFALSRGVDVVASLPQVDSDRIGMYGLSQGGMSATFLGALETRLQAVVSSAYFNERYNKQVVPSEHYGRFVDTSSEDHIYTHLAEFSDSDLASVPAGPEGLRGGEGHLRSLGAWRQVRHLHPRRGPRDRTRRGRRRDQGRAVPRPVAEGVTPACATAGLVRPCLPPSPLRGEGTGLPEEPPRCPRTP